MKQKTLRAIDTLIDCLIAEATDDDWAYIDERYIGDHGTVEEFRNDREMLRSLVFEMCQPYDPCTLIGKPIKEALRLPR